MRKIFFIVLIIILSYWSFAPLLSKDYFSMHDDTQPSRVYEMAKGLKFGQFPVRWVPDLGYGYGYPLFNFYAPFPYYIGALFNLLGVSAIASTKIMMIIGLVLSAVMMYLFVQQLEGNIAGVVSAVLYVYAPYHAVNLYVRGAIGELYAYAFLPLFLLGIYNIVKSSKNRSRIQIGRGIAISSIGYAFILISHNILGMVTSYFIAFLLLIYFLYLLVKRRKLFTVYYLVFSILLGIGLSSFFTLPAVLEKKYTKVNQLIQKGSDFRNHFVYLDQLWDSPWGFAGSAKGREDGMSFKIGKLHLILGSFGFIFILLLNKNKRISKEKFLLFSSLLLIIMVSIYFMLSSSKVLWNILPGFSFIQYPWRFLNFVLLSLAVLPVSLFINRGKYLQVVIAIIIIVTTIFINNKYFTPQTFISKSDSDYISDINIRYKISKISDEYMPKEFIPPTSSEKIAFKPIQLTNDINIENMVDEPTEKKFRVISKEEKGITSNIAFFPGWKVYFSGNEEGIYNTQGKLSFNLPSGESDIEIVLTDTPIRKVGNIISIFSLFLLLYLSFTGKKIRLWQKKAIKKSQ